MLFFHLTDKELKLKEPKAPTAGEGGQLGRSGAPPPCQIPRHGPGRRARVTSPARDQAADLRARLVGAPGSGRRGGQSPTCRGGRQASGRNRCIVRRVSCKPSVGPLFQTPRVLRP